MIQSRRAALALLCGAGPGSGVKPFAGDLWIRTELYFGSARTDGSRVSDRELADFLDQEVTPRFPAGLTAIEAHGQFRKIKEKSVLLIVFYPMNQAGVDARLQEIREAYRRRFRQDSVLRADAVVRVSP